ncbi:hypothetical protein [Anaerofustis sp.]|uniref:hypothetical protein n=1 Tax=Anaerofustis sp. TaxID=1872517 RepID=UPI0025BD5B42|nr:hypothetical protein [Anaerofustis sp.]
MNKNKKNKKKIAPIIIGALMIVVFIIYIVSIVILPIPILIKIIGSAIFLGLIGLMIYVVIERIKEIEKGEEDDLSNY